MAQNITLMGANYTAVPAVQLPKTGGGTATFVDEEEIITYYTGSTNPSSSLGENGDIYLKVVRYGND